MAVYYNEIDPFAAEWLRQLIKSGLIADGVVDERSIEDVRPNEIREFVQCHFFAGIGVWSYALRNAGWADDRPVWTGSCPCQPFSTAGKGKGFADERHLWPAFFHLIKECRPVTVFGEQVASKVGRTWIDLVQADLEGMDYRCGAIDTCAAGFGAPHIRQRLYWVADSALHAKRALDRKPRTSEQQEEQNRGRGFSCELADHTCERCGETWEPGIRQAERVSVGSDIDGVAYAVGNEKYKEQQRPEKAKREWYADKPSGCSLDSRERVEVERPGPTNGFWRSSDWVGCTDNKFRAVEPGAFPLVDGAPARVGRLRGYGNAIVADQAQAFIESYLEVLEDIC